MRSGCWYGAVAKSGLVGWSNVDLYSTYDDERREDEKSDTCEVRTHAPRGNTLSLLR